MLSLARSRARSQIAFTSPSSRLPEFSVRIVAYLLFFDHQRAVCVLKIRCEHLARNTRGSFLNEFLRLSRALALRYKGEEEEEEA